MTNKTIIIEATDAYDPQRRGIGVQMRTWLELAPYADFPNFQFVIAHKEAAGSESLRIEASNVQQITQSADTEEVYIDSLYELNGDLLFFPLAAQKYIRESSAKKIGIDYGMEDFYCRNYIAPRPIDDLLDEHEYAMQNFTDIITVSNTSKRDLAWFFPEHKDKIRVVYPGSVVAANNDMVQLPEPLQNGQYFFILGYEQKKNITRIAQAFDEFKQKTGSQAKLAIAGKPGYGASEIDAYINALKHGSDIVHLGYISDEQKQVLLQQCHAVVALAIYEGFGISALEGMAAGKIVLVSDNGSLAEIVGDAGYTADPFSVQSITNAFIEINALQENPKAQYIPDRLAVFDQSIQARQLLQYLSEIAAS